MSGWATIPPSSSTQSPWPYTLYHIWFLILVLNRFGGTIFSSMALLSPSAGRRLTHSSLVIYIIALQVKSAFATAYSSLTDAHILSLEPQKSILGTIIRPDAVLLQRKGGSKGDLTFDRLLPGAGEGGRLGFEGGGDILCNWQLTEEEPLPRETALRSGGSSPSRKRKASKPSRRPSSNGHGRSPAEDKSGKRKEKRTKKHQGKWRRPPEEIFSHLGKGGQPLELRVYILCSYLSASRLTFLRKLFFDVPAPPLLYILYWFWCLFMSKWLETSLWVEKMRENELSARTFVAFDL